MKHTGDGKRGGDRKRGSDGRPEPRRDRRPDQRHERRRWAPEGTDEPVMIWGMHAVEAALANRARTIDRIWATENAANRLAGPIAERQLRAERVQPRDLDRRLGPDTVHQGVLVEARPLPDCELAALALTIVDRGPIVVLDQVTDPHNVGAILRSAAVFGSAGVVMTRRHSPPLGGALAKAASGALEAVPVALVANLARAMTDLKDVGVELIGLDGAAEMLLDETVLSPRMTGRAYALVLGAEGKGLRQLTAETCDQLCRIGGGGSMASLNVSNAAAVALHLGAMARRRALGQ